MDPRALYTPGEYSVSEPVLACYSWILWLISVILAFERLGQEECHEFKASLGSIVSFKLIWATNISPTPTKTKQTIHDVTDGRCYT